VDLVQTPTVPFCSDRCRLVDLGRWLDESYGVPAPAPVEIVESPVIIKALKLASESVVIKLPSM